MRVQVPLGLHKEIDMSIIKSPNFETAALKLEAAFKNTTAFAKSQTDNLDHVDEAIELIDKGMRIERAVFILSSSMSDAGARIHALDILEGGV